MSPNIPLRPVEELRAPTMSELVFDELYRRVVDLSVPPGTKLSEIEVARQMGVSRQPVRDAFYRLSQLGFLMIRPQRATTVARISEQAVLQARFIRTALEMETVRTAARMLNESDLADLQDLIAQQQAAVAADDRLLFHALDDQFHRRICEGAGLDFAWGLIRENKGHMDRVRYLSLSFGAQAALDDHVAILDALRQQDENAAADIMRVHLSRITTILDRIREDHPDIFEETRP